VRSKFVARWNRALPALDAVAEAMGRRRAIVVADLTGDATGGLDAAPLLSHCKSLLKLGFEVAYAPVRHRDATAAEIPLLMRNGVTVSSGGGGAADALAERGKPYDLVYLHGSGPLHQLTEIARRSQPAARIVGWLGGGDELANLAAGVAGEQPAVDCLVTPSAIIAARARRSGARAVRMLWGHRQPASPVPFEGRQGFCLLGRFDRPADVGDARHATAALWPAVSAGALGATLEIAGPQLDAASFEPVPDGVVLRGHCADVAAYLSTRRVVLAPRQATGEPHWGTLLALAQGVPCVMTLAAAEGLELPDPLRSMLVARDEEAFIRKARRFYGERAIWSEASERSCDWAREHLSQPAIDETWASVVAVDEAPARTAPATATPDFALTAG
jgi:O-antigen biosynthesis protein